MSFDSNQSAEPPEELLQTAREHFARMRKVLHRLLNRIEQGDAKAVGELEGCRMQLSKSLSNVIEQEAKLEALCNAKAAAGGGGDLDLDAARAEVGRRLACLRAAGDGGAVSGGPDG